MPEIDQALAGTAPVIILVEPQLGENIGMVARAMANFALTELRLVNPRDGWPSEKARAAASRADHVIDGVVLFDDTRSAVADLQFVFATTARQRDGFKPVRGPAEAARTLHHRVRAGERVGILFGRERFGLSNEEVALADEIVTFPVDPDFASLNIAQAVLLMSYEWRRQAVDDATPFSGPEAPPATKDVLHGFIEHMETALDSRGYFRPRAKKARMVDKLRAVFTRPGFSDGELKVLRGILSSLDRFSPTMRRGDGSPGDDPRRLPSVHARAADPAEE